MTLEKRNITNAVFVSRYPRNIPVAAEEMKTAGAARARI